MSDDDIGGTWSSVAIIHVRGIPKGQPRPRAFAMKGKICVYNPGTAEAWKSAIAEAARPFVPETPLEGPIRVNITWYLPRPKRLCRKKDWPGPLPHVAKPDRDNLDKAVLDALKTIGFYRDDSQVCDGVLRKRYPSIGIPPGADISIWRWVT